MKYRTKPYELDAFQFAGSFGSYLAAQDWLSSLDVENCEITIQGEEGRYGLDLQAQGFVQTLEPGDWLIYSDGEVDACTDEHFRRCYEPA